MNFNEIQPFLLVPAFLLAALCTLSPAETLPRLAGESLSNKAVILPDDAHGHVAFLICGFSRKGGQATDPWKQRLKKDFGTDPSYRIYSIAVLEDAPRLMRGIIKSGIRRGMPEAEQDRFIVIVEGEAILKRSLGFSAPDDPYITLIDADGKVRFSVHGTFGEENYAPLREAAAKLMK